MSLELGAPADEMERLADRVNAVAARHGGFVLSSSVSSGQEDGGGDFDLRIPAARLRPAIRDLSALGTLHSQTQSGRDVTRPYVTLAARRQAARRSVRASCAAWPRRTTTSRRRPSAPSSTRWTAGSRGFAPSFAGCA